VNTLAFFLFAGLPTGWQVYFIVAFVIVAAMFLWTVVLFVRAGHAERHVVDADPHGADSLAWVFLVPALNEELTIRDSVERLLAVPVARRRIVVIDDASDDATSTILRGIAHPDLTVIRRELPDARRGKAAALNHAYRMVRDSFVDHDRVIVVVVDADGRLYPDAPRYAAAHFADPTVGGVQSRVRIYNRRHLLTWLQDVEFGVYGSLFQTGRNDWGTAGMGGNGQFNRLSALEAVADEQGPWRDRLTEDQDLGLRLIAEGWAGHQDLRATVDQQGLPKLRPLLRQRTRWSQGNLQAFGLVGAVTRAPSCVASRIELLAYVFMPIWQGLIGLALVSAFVLAIAGVAPFWGGGPTWQLLLVYLLAFGGTVLGCIAAKRQDGARGWVLGFLIGHVYALYTWLIWPVLVRSTYRQLTGRGTWAKTRREPLDAHVATAATTTRDVSTNVAS
jgi:cellulose synthase/poly-beta-1,6-N-acetylglucosamine synthase-like glycosyltransferase